MNTWVRLGIACVVTVVWLVSYGVSIVNHHYHPAPELNGIMLLVAGFFFASGIREQGAAREERELEEMRHMIDEEIEKTRHTRRRQGNET